MTQNRPGWERYLPFFLLAGAVGCVLLIGWRWVDRERGRERERERDSHAAESGGEVPTPSLIPEPPPYLSVTMNFPKISVYAVTFTPDGRHLVVAGAGIDARFRDQPMARVWNLNENREMVTLQRKEEVGRYTAVAVSSDGRFAAASGVVVADSRVTGNVCVWDLETGEVRWSRRMAKHADRVTWSPDGACIAAGDQAGNVGVWDAMTGEPRGSVPLNESGWVSALAWSGDSKQLAIGCRPGVRVWDVAERREVVVLDTEQDRVSGLAFGPDDRTVFGGMVTRGAVWSWDLPTAKPSRKFGGQPLFVAGFALGPNARSFITVAHGQPSPGMSGLMARCLGTSGRMLWTVSAQTDENTRAPFAVTPDGRRLALGVMTRTQDWNTAWSVEIHELPPPPP